MAVQPYIALKHRLARGTVRWATDAVYALLVDADYEFSDVHRTVVDLGDSVLDVEHVSVPGREVELDYEGGAALLLASSFAFAQVSGVVGGIVLYTRGGPDESTPAYDQLLAFLEADPALELDEEELDVELPDREFLRITS